MEGESRPRPGRSASVPRYVASYVLGLLGRRRLGWLVRALLLLTGRPCTGHETTYGHGPPCHHFVTVVGFGLRRINVFGYGAFDHLNGLLCLFRNLGLSLILRLDLLKDPFSERA